MNLSPVILDFDASPSLPREGRRLDLRAWEPSIRYSASFADMSRLQAEAAPRLRGADVAFIGSGDFHHVTYALLRLRPEKALHLVVLDNHPDNMIFLRGIHCGSWVYHAARLPGVAKVSVIGITSEDVAGVNLLQNHYSVLRSGKVSYHCFRAVPRAMALLSGGGARDARGARARWDAWLREEILGESGPEIYLSIDKDVLSAAGGVSTWDQGVMEPGELLSAVRVLRPRLAAVDVVGEPSFHAYASPFKAALTALDGCAEPREIDPEPHARVNSGILAALRA